MLIEIARVYQQDKQLLTQLIIWAKDSKPYRCVYSFQKIFFKKYKEVQKINARVIGGHQSETRGAEKTYKAVDVYIIYSQEFMILILKL